MIALTPESYHGRYRGTRPLKLEQNTGVGKTLTLRFLLALVLGRVVEVLGRVFGPLVTALL
jgi:hypothetical protein